MKASRTILIALIPVGFVLIMGIVIWTNWTSVSTGFFSFTLTDVIDNFLTLVIGVVITYFVGISFTNRQKKIEVLVSVIDMYLSDLKFVMGKLHNAMQNGKDFNGSELTREMRHLLKMASNDLAAIIEVNKKCSLPEYDTARFKSEHLELKSAITNEPINSADDVKSRYDESVSAYYAIKNSMHLLKLSFYG